MPTTGSSCQNRLDFPVEGGKDRSEVWQ